MTTATRLMPNLTDPMTSLINDLPDLILPSEVAPVLRRTERSVRRLVAQRHLPGVKIGGRVYVRRADLIALLRGETAAVPA